MTSVHITDIASWCAISFGHDYSFGEDANPLVYAHNLYINNKLITNLIIPNGVTGIGDNAFRGCKCLTSVEIPNSVTSIGESAFEGCKGLTSVTIPNSVTNIVQGAFTGCSNITSIVWNAKKCTLTAYTDIKYTPFYYIRNQIISFVFGEEVERIPMYLCYGMSKLKSVEIPNSVTSIGEHSFNNCIGLNSVAIPNSVTSIGYYAFYGCTGLTSLTIGNGVTSIGESAFEGCKGLTSVTCYSTTPPYLMEDVFAHVECSQIPLYVPAESVSAYKATDQWKDFNVKAIGTEEDALPEILTDENAQNGKYLIDGDIYILRDGKTYTLQGQEVR